MTDVNTYIDALIGREGPYSNDPNDSGGETMYGITAAVARAYGYTGSMKAMPRDMAVSIYKSRYWVAPKFDQVAAIDSPIGVKLLDFGVNCGQATAAKALQRCLTALNSGGSAYSDISVDGQIGALTLAALKTFVAQRGDLGRKTLLFMIAAQQSAHYLALAEQNPSQKKFEFGWQSQRALMGISQ